MGKITQPAPIKGIHHLDDFSCGVLTLDEWLIKRALKNQDQGASRTFVCCEDNKVIGYYALATGSVERATSPGGIARNMPSPIPVIVLGRLAVDSGYQGKRLGAHLLKDAILRTLAISQQVGVRCLLVHAISESAKNFYQSYGFQESPIDPMTLFLSLQQAQKMLE